MEPEGLLPFHMSWSLDYNLSCMSPVHILTFCFLKSRNGLFPPHFPTKILYVFFILPVYAPICKNLTQVKLRELDHCLVPGSFCSVVVKKKHGQRNGSS